MIFHVNRVSFFESLYHAFKCVISLLAHHISNQRNEPLSADNSCQDGTIIGLLESGIPEQAFVKKSYRHALSLIPTYPLVVVFPAHISLRFPHDEDEESFSRKRISTWSDFKC